MSEAKGRTPKPGAPVARILLAVTSVPSGPAENGSRLGPKQARRMPRVEGLEGGACLGQGGSEWSSSQQSLFP